MTSNFDGNVASGQHSENLGPPFLNSQLFPDIYFASNGLSINHSNSIALVPTAPYEPIGTILTADLAPAAIHQTSTSQITVTNGARMENNTTGTIRSNSAPAREDDDLITGYASNYNPNERIERMFGISPPWR
jgi:hypothetical protein